MSNAVAEVEGTTDAPITPDTKTTVDTQAAVEQLRKEEALRFGDEVKIHYEPHFPIEDISAPDDFNYRLKGGQTVGGVVVKTDLRNIGGMADSIRALGGVTTPLVLSKREDGSHILCQGYRRLNGAKLVRSQEPNSPLAIRLAELPCVVYEGLTRDQERQLVNDQTSKFYTSSEVFQIFAEQVDGGYGWEPIARRMYPQIGMVTNSLDKVQQIDAIQDENKKREELIAWLTTTVQQFWWNAIKAGPITRNLTMQTYMWKDGHTNVRPRVVMDSMRMRALQTEIRKDIKEGHWNKEEGRGTRFDAKLAEMELADKKKYDKPAAGEGGDTPPTVRLKKLSDVQGLIEDARRVRKAPEGLVERLFKIVLKDGGDPAALRSVHNFDRCSAMFKLHKDFVKPDVAAVLNLVFDGGEGAEEQFAAFLMDNYAVTPPTEEVPTETVNVEAALEAEADREVAEEVAETEGADEDEGSAEDVLPVVADHPEAGAGTDAPKTPTGKPKRRGGKRS